MKIISPNLSKDLIELSQFSLYAKESIEQERVIQGAKINGVREDDQNFDRLEITQSVLMQVVFRYCSLQRATFQDVLFQNCDFSNCNLNQAYFERCRFENCKGVGVNLHKASLKQTTFLESNLSYANFDGAKLTNIMIEKTDCTEASFSEVEWKKIYLCNSRFIKNNFFKTSLAQVDFRSCDFLAPLVSSSPVELRGAVVNLFQAGELISLFGVEVKD